MIYSPLQYPGGKTRAVKTIRSYFPARLKKLVSPFFGGGSIEISCARDGIPVSGYDIHEPLVNFWQHAISNATALATSVASYYPLTRERYYELKDGFYDISNKFEQAAVYYVINRCSYSGLTLLGGMSSNHPRFTLSSIDRLKNFSSENLSVNCSSFIETLEKHKNDFCYLDPPYTGNRGLYNDDIDHSILAEILQERTGWILSYNDCPEVRHWYSKYDFVDPTWKYGMSKNKNSSEVLILNL